MTPVEKVVGALEATGSRRNGRDWQCPAHQDQHASLSVSEGREGRVLLKCHAGDGCPVERIVTALGLTMADLFPDGSGVFDDTWTPRGPAIASYPYVDEHGRMHFTVCRTEAKDFPQWRPDPAAKTGKRWKLNDDAGRRLVPWLLYRLPRVLEAARGGGTVFVVEGEKDVHALEAKGMVATCNPGGAGKWREEYAQALAGCSSVIVVADRDEEGRKHAARVAATLEAAGVSVELVEPREGKDAADHLAAGHGPFDFRPVDEEEKPPGGGRTRAAVQPGEVGMLLEEIIALLGRFVVFSSDAQAVAVALWVVHTHVIDAADATPYLWLTSPEPESGKTRVHDVAEHLVARPWRVVSPSEATVYRKIEADRPAVFLDEIDAVFTKDQAGNYEFLRALLGAGYRRGVKVPRCVGEGSRQQVVDFEVFSAKTFAGIGNCLPDTIESRSIPIRMQRRKKSEPVERFFFKRVRAEAAPVRERLEAWAASATKLLADAEPDLPSKLGDRQAEVWEPLLAVSDLAGGPWPERARAAAVELHGGSVADEEPFGPRLLAHIRDAFDEQPAERLATGRLLEFLLDREGWWARELEAGRTKGPAAKLAKALRVYGIRPQQLKIDGENVRGYSRSAFTDAWERYSRTPGSPPPPVSDATTLPRRSEPLFAETASEANMASEQGSSEVASPQRYEGGGASSGHHGDGQATTESGRVAASAAIAPGSKWARNTSEETIADRWAGAGTLPGVAADPDPRRHTR